MKDPETGFIEHKFLELLPYSSQCKLCNSDKSEHRVEEEIKKDIKIEENQQLFEGDEGRVIKEIINPKATKLTANILQKSITFSKEVLEGFEDPNLCYICCTNKVDESSAEFSDCKHLFCKQCIKTHLTMSINNGQV